MVVLTNIDALANRIKLNSQRQTHNPSLSWQRRKLTIKQNKTNHFGEEAASSTNDDGKPGFYGAKK